MILFDIKSKLKILLLYETIYAVTVDREPNLVRFDY